MRLFLLGILAVVTFACAWLLLYQIGRLFFALMPSMRILVLGLITVASAFIAWRAVREILE